MNIFIWVLSTRVALSHDILLHDIFSYLTKYWTCSTWKNCVVDTNNYLSYSFIRRPSWATGYMYSEAMHLVTGLKWIKYMKRLCAERRTKIVFWTIDELFNNRVLPQEGDVKFVDVWPLKVYGKYQRKKCEENNLQR